MLAPAGAPPAPLAPPPLRLVFASPTLPLCLHDAAEAGDAAAVRAMLEGGADVLARDKARALAGRFGRQRLLAPFHLLASLRRAAPAVY